MKKLKAFFNPQSPLIQPEQLVPLELLATLRPSYGHFQRFAVDSRLAGIRINSAMISTEALEEELSQLRKCEVTVPLYFDIKGRQLRVVEVHEHPMCLEITLNHPIRIADPRSEEIGVLFKASKDSALLRSVSEDGTRLLFEPAEKHGPKYKVRPGESLYIRHPSLLIEGPLFTELERKKIEMVRDAGFTNFFLSYVESEDDVTEFLDLVGHNAQLRLKIESKRGLAYVTNEYFPRSNIRLVAALGDLYVEIDSPHQILQALPLIIEKDPQAMVASRILLSTVESPVPELNDFLELAWLYDIGYRTMMLCDEICLKKDLLSRALNVLESFRQTYPQSIS